MVMQFRKARAHNAPQEKAAAGSATPSNAFSDSARLTAQRERISAVFGSALQRKSHTFGMPEGLVQHATPSKVVQRKIVFTSDNSEYISNSKRQVQTKLIKNLISHFENNLGTSPGRGWKKRVWEMQKNGTHSFTNLDDLARDLLQKYPKKKPKTDSEDQAMRDLLEERGKGGSTMPERQMLAMHAMALDDDDDDREAMRGFLQHERNQGGLRDKVRMGGKNETLLSKQTPEAALRSFGGVPGVEATSTTKSGQRVSWVSEQQITAAPTHFFVFKNTHDKDGGQMQDSHTSAGRIYRTDAASKKHATVGNTTASNFI